MISGLNLHRRCPLCGRMVPDADLEDAQLTERSGRHRGRYRVTRICRRLCSPRAVEVWPLAEPITPESL